MKISRKDLNDALAQLIKIAPKKSSMDVLRFVRIVSTEKQCTLRTTDLDQWLSGVFVCSGTPIDACLPINSLYKLVKGTKKDLIGDVTIEMDGYSGRVSCDGVDATLSGTVTEDYPTMDTQEYQSIGSLDVSSFTKTLKFVLPAVSTDYTQPHINCLSVQGKRMIATDGHRCHYLDMSSGYDKNSIVNLPRESVKALQSISKGNKTIYTDISDGYAKYVVGPWTLEAKLSLGDFPPYEQIIPDKTENHFTCDAKVFAKMIKVGQGLGGNRSGGKFIVGQKLFVEIATEEKDLASLSCAMIENTFGQRDEEYFIGANLDYISDLVVDTDTVTLSMGDKLDPIRFDGSNGEVAIVMPRRV